MLYPVIWKFNSQSYWQFVRFTANVFYHWLLRIQDSLVVSSTVDLSSLLTAETSATCVTFRVPLIEGDFSLSLVFFSFFRGHFI